MTDRLVEIALACPQASQRGLGIGRVGDLGIIVIGQTPDTSRHPPARLAALRCDTATATVVRARRPLSRGRGSARGW